VSDQIPISDLQTGADPWVCPRCGRENKGAWTTCPGCESSRDGRPPAAAAAATTGRSTSGLSVLLGLVVLAALVVLVVLVAPTVWQWVADQAATFWTWVDSRT
jgi:hypothetical protein